jgi:hypothetical protein
MEQDKGYNQEKKKKVSFSQRWREAQPTKKVLFWSCVASIILTMIVGFAWGGWVTGGTAQKMARKMADEAVVKRLAPICVVQFNQDIVKEQKLSELKEMSNWSRRDYVQKQGWATMPGEENPDRKVADACANLLMQISQTTSSL